jgi:hypothetical protein
VALRGVESAGCEDLAALPRFTVPLRLDPCSTFKIRPECRAVKSCASRGKWPAYGLIALTIADGATTEITGFRDPALFHGFALPATLG